MSLADYKTALSDLRTLITNGDLVGARRQLLITRTYLAGVPDGTFDGAQYKLRTGELDKLEEQLDREVERSRSGQGDRAIHTRTTFPTRCPGW